MLTIKHSHLRFDKDKLMTNIYLNHVFLCCPVHPLCLQLSSCLKLFKRICELCKYSDAKHLYSQPINFIPNHQNLPLTAIFLPLVYSFIIMIMINKIYVHIITLTCYNNSSFLGITNEQDGFIAEP